jgi:hypothetical protein
LNDFLLDSSLALKRAQNDVEEETTNMDAGMPASYKKSSPLLVLSPTTKNLSWVIKKRM